MHIEISNRNHPQLARSFRVFKQCICHSARRIQVRSKNTGLIGQRLALEARSQPMSTHDDPDIIWSGGLEAQPHELDKYVMPGS